MLLRHDATRRRSPGVAVAFALSVVFLAGCTSTHPRSDASRRSAHPVTKASSDRSRSSSTDLVPTTTLAPTTTTGAPPTTTPPAVPPTSPPTTDAPSPATTAPPSTGPATGGAASSGAQLITVTAPEYDDSANPTATLEAYQRSSSGGWQLVFGPWTANVGYNGVAPPGQKREGDGRTPSGTYGFGFFFGDLSEPSGIAAGWDYHQATSCDVWDDQPGTANYNQWVDECAQGAAAAGSNPEPMYDEPSYYYGAVIDYNTDPVVSDPPMGSAIFLHVSPGGATAGCVAVPEDDLLQVLRWLDPADSPQIQIGVG